MSPDKKVIGTSKLHHCNHVKVQTQAKDSKRAWGRMVGRKTKQARGSEIQGSEIQFVRNLYP